MSEVLKTFAKAVTCVVGIGVGARILETASDLLNDTSLDDALADLAKTVKEVGLVNDVKNGIIRVEDVEEEIDELRSMYRLGSDKPARMPAKDESRMAVLRQLRHDIRSIERTGSLQRKSRQVV